MEFYSFFDKQKKQKNAEKWNKQAEKQSKLKKHKDNNEYVYTLVYSILNDKEEPFGKPHGSFQREFEINKQCDKIWRERSY